MLEAGGGDDLEDAEGVVGGVPEGVPLVAGLEGEVAGLGVDDVVSEEGAHAALEDEAVLVDSLMAVAGGAEGAGRHWVFD